MPVMLSKTYEAFVAAGASEEKARAAAEELAAYEAQFATVKEQLADIRGRITLVQWMLGVVIAADFAIIVRIFA